MEKSAPIIRFGIPNFDDSTIPSTSLPISSTTITRVKKTTRKETSGSVSELVFTTAAIFPDAQPDNLNCAQAVLHAYQAKTGDRALSVPEYRAFGGGRAPEGECGALYAACQCAPESAAQLREAFRAKAGATQCRVLKQELKFPCPSCVGLGAELLEQTLKR